MKRRGLTIFAVAAGLLVALILGEWIAGLSRIGRIDAPARIADAAPGRPAAIAETGAADEDIDAWLHTTLGRPLMSSTRTPAAHLGGPSVSLNGGLPRLAGTLSSAAGGGRTAIFARDDGGHPLIVHEGGTLGPYRVARIEPGTVTLDGPSGRQVLHTHFAAGGAAATTDLTTPGLVPAPNLPPGFPVPGVPGQPFPSQNFPGLVPPQPGPIPQPQAQTE